jgi:hypothetical protein
MASKKEEITAWEMLKIAFPNSYVSLELEYNHYNSDEKDTVLYHAYVDISGDYGANCIGKEFASPIDAVQNLINKQKKGGKGCRLISRKS